MHSSHPFYKRLLKYSPRHVKIREFFIHNKGTCINCGVFHELEYTSNGKTMTIQASHKFHDWEHSAMDQYQPLCPSCHLRYDKQDNAVKRHIKAKYGETMRLFSV